MTPDIMKRSNIALIVAALIAFAAAGVFAQEEPGLTSFTEGVQARIGLAAAW
ncbi:MAG: hypothetical protein ACOCX2_13155 [Armatimonadota bacterium]